MLTRMTKTKKTDTPSVGRVVEYLLFLHLLVGMFHLGTLSII